MSRPSPYSVLPRRSPRVPAYLARVAWEIGGEHGLRTVVAPLVAEHAHGRASSPEEVRLLREWVRDAVEDAVAYFAERFTAQNAEVASRPA